MPTQTTERLARPIDAESWKPFGWLPVRDTDSRDGGSRMTFQWADPHVNIISHTADEVDHVGRALVCPELFRHLTHTQALFVMDSPCVIAVAPAGATFATVADLEQIAAFTLEPGQSVVLHQGTWHWGPFPVSAPQVTLFNVQGIRYAEDNDRASLSHLEAALCVMPASAEH